MNDIDKVVFRNVLEKTTFYICTPAKERISSGDDYNKNDRHEDVWRILKLYTKLKCKGIKKFMSPSHISDFFYQAQNPTTFENVRTYRYSNRS